ncbi:hypothetical protein CANINC_001497 [Pichia inconspicua]|uniref:Uncharacterized protein n=1 Tax=Pichia inconspicua TaxID=52247 RepID=A0A4T0X411_9ASCO|nr:hypothetical protein CANINC_001497 [[Candida] inconspicua]
MTFVEYFPRINTTNIYTNICDIDEFSVVDGMLTISNQKYPILLTHNVKNYTSCVSDGPNGKIIRLRDASERSETEDVEYTWTAKELQLHHYIKCNSCNCELIDISQLRKVLPMPSEMWNEMVDFWHCHKPNGSEVITKRFNGLKPGHNGVLVGPYYFIFNPEDFKTIKVQENDVGCSNCDYLLGSKDENFGCYKLLKWRVSLDDDHFEKWRYIYFKLIEEVKFTGTHKFTLVCGDKYLKVWCFSLGIEFVTKNIKYNNGMKILYDEAEERKDGEYIIEIEYVDVFEDFIKILRRSNEILKSYGLDNFGKWKVGYIGDIKSGND